MNGLEEIQGIIRNFIYEKKYVQNQIAEVENKRTQLAEKRNEKKKSNSDYVEINELGIQISELGNQSQELQKKLDYKFHGVKSQVNLIIDNLVSEGIRKIRKTNEEIQDLNRKIELQKERQAKYQLQRQEFFVRFGRMPELSENTVKQNDFQEHEAKKSSLEIEKLELQIKEIEGEISELVTTKREFKNGNWKCIIGNENSNEEIRIETLKIEEIETIEEIFVEEFNEVEELYVEPFEAIEEIEIPEFEGIKETGIETVENIQEKEIDKIEELAKAIVEEIVAQQTINYNGNITETVEENVKLIEEDVAEDIITFEEEKKEKTKIPLFWQRATISSITIKFEDKQLVYKAQMSNDEEVKIYPAKLGEESVLLRDNQNRAECKEILTNYAVNAYKIFDKKVINKIDPLVCELLIECAEKYGLEAQELMYNYAMSFSNSELIDMELVPGIIYNLSYIEQSELSKKEKAIMKKICKNAKRNSGIDIIEGFSGFKKIKYIFKRLFAVNNVKVLPEAKY